MRPPSERPRRQPYVAQLLATLVAGLVLALAAMISIGGLQIPAPARSLVLDPRTEEVAGAQQSSSLPMAAKAVAAGLAGGAPESAPYLDHEDLSAEFGVEFGTLLESTLLSPTLRREMPYQVYLPPGYDLSSQRYPVVYLLHGGGGSYTEWGDAVHIGLFADAMIAEGRIRPMILVMPHGENYFFMNLPQGGDQWARYLVRDVVEHVDRHYRTLPGRENRALGGLSMGGLGALQLAFNHPDVFSTVVASSPSLRLRPEDLPPHVGDWSHYADYDPLRLAATREGLDRLRISIDIGAQDNAWLPGNLRLHEVLDSRGLRHRFAVNPGFHWTTYWIEHAPEYLAAYSEAFGGSASDPGPASIVSSRGAGREPGRPLPEAAGPCAPLPTPGPGADRRQNPYRRPSADVEEESLRRRIDLAVRGLRVYAALPDSQYTRRQALQGLAALQACSRPATGHLAEAVADYLPAAGRAIEEVHVGWMRALADDLCLLAE